MRLLQPSGGIELEGWVRLGLQEDFGEAVLPEVAAGRFARANPKVRIEARIGRSHDLAEAYPVRGSLDIATRPGTMARCCAYSRPIADVQMRWIASGQTGGRPLRRRRGVSRWWRSTRLACSETRCDGNTRPAPASPGAWPFPAPASWRHLGGGGRRPRAMTIRTDIGLPANVQGDRAGNAEPAALPKMALHLHQRDAELDPVAAAAGGDIAAGSSGDAAGGVGEPVKDYETSLSSALLRPTRERVVRGAQRRCGSARRRHIEGLAQAVRQVAHIGLRHRIRPRALDDKTLAAGSWPG